jgi:LacI family transcriptional regulator
MTTQTPPSIYDVATAAGVSPGTVSRVLNRRGNISQATRTIVLETARKMRFRSRVSSRKITFAIVTDKAQYATFGGFLSCLHTNLTDEIAKSDVAIQLFTEANLDSLGEHNVDGILSMVWIPSTIRKLRELHEQSGVPVLTFNRSDIQELASVQSDFHQGGHLVGEYLANKGHRRIAYLVEEFSEAQKQRLGGMTSALASSGIGFDENMVFLTRHNRIVDVLQRMMTYNPTAIFVACEDLVLETLSTLRDQLNIDVPGDISLVGMENIHVNRFTSPPVTSLLQPFESMVEQAMELMMGLIQNKASIEHRVLPNQFIERLSVKQIHQD